MKTKTTFKKMAEQLQKIPLNAQTFIIWTQKPEVVNTIAAFYHKHLKTVVINPTYRDIEKDILDFCPDHKRVIYGDSFQIDTWDKILEKSITVPEIEEKYTNAILQDLANKYAELRGNFYSHESDNDIDYLHDIILYQYREIRNTNVGDIKAKDVLRLYDAYLAIKSTIESNRLIIDNIVFG